jgi:hypothetical protein
MKQVSLRAGGRAAVLLGIMAVSGGCTEDQTGFFILGNVAAEAPDCVATTDPGSPMYSSGTLDVALRSEYEASLLVGSQLTPRGDKANLRTETMITTITGAEVQLLTDTGALETEFTVPAAGVILPDSSADPGFGLVTATLIPTDSGNRLAEELNNPAEIKTRIARVVVFGKTIGGLEVETAPLSYVIRVCEGCLVEFPASSYDPVSGCVPSGAGVAAPCRPGQDEAVDCRFCANQNSYCQFPGGVPPQ